MQRRGGRVWGGGLFHTGVFPPYWCPLPSREESGEGAVPPPQKKNSFSSANGVFWGTFAHFLDINIHINFPSPAPRQTSFPPSFGSVSKKNICVVACYRRCANCAFCKLELCSLSPVCHRQTENYNICCISLHSTLVKSPAFRTRSGRAGDRAGHKEEKVGGTDRRGPPVQ